MTKETFGHRVELRCDGELILGFSAQKRPANHTEMLALLQELMVAMNAPGVPDPEVLGKWSPQETWIGGEGGDV